MLEVAVIAIDDPRWQERPLAILRVKEGFDIETLPSTLRGYLLDKVAKFWVPEYWAHVEDIPKTSVGKIDKKQLRDMLAAGTLAVQQHASFGRGDE